jgi:hypothetical protein
MSDLPDSPFITGFSWGRLEVEGGRVYKDAKLFPGGSREWDWRETGTGHKPGVQPTDVEELLQHGATVIVLGQGVYGRLRVGKKTRQLLTDKGIALHALKTPAAIELYNELRLKEPVGCLLHSTC